MELDALRESEAVVVCMAMGHGDKMGYRRDGDGELHF